ncbi:phosphoribosylaminoimidazolesuccinocarboxamide synthase, partial [Candidatus Roseilinea sp. NK_OTU-006]|uniref:phosphoribosylaminoimidazolesuccinocarboxamide synthase n=1 Tax=Candidatus Roseilinea sp. NK_OTU-006 TaxID=2704250 RepID=UPI002715364F
MKLPTPFVQSDLPLGPRHAGKVRDWYDLPGGRRALVATDRLSAFDCILGAIPYKGQVLNQLSAFWFERTRDIVPNHLLEVPDPNVSIVKVCRPWPVEIVVRGYITGVTATSLWTLYARGERELYGVRLPDGLRKNDRLPHPIITPTTKAVAGAHDERTTRDEIIARGLVPEAVYAQIERAALALFARGSEICVQGGLTLTPEFAALLDWVDTGVKPTPAAIAQRCKAFEPEFGAGCRFLPHYRPAPLESRV